MNQDMAPLYGELVITSPDKNHAGIPDEVNAMQEQTRLMIEEAAYSLAKKRGFALGYELEDWLKAEAQILK